MQQQSIKKGVIPWTNSTGSAVSAGDVVDLGNRAGVALVDIANAAIGSVATEGVFLLAKDTSTITQENEVYWDVDAEAVTTTQGLSDPRLGIAVKAAATGDEYCHVEINAPRTVGATAIDSGAGDAAGNALAIRRIIVQLEAAGIIKQSQGLT